MSAALGLPLKIARAREQTRCGRQACKIGDPLMVKKMVPPLGKKSGPLAGPAFALRLSDVLCFFKHPQSHAKRALFSTRL